MAKLHIRRTVIFIILGIVCGLIYSMVTPKVYESRLLLVVGTPNLGTRSGAENLPADVKEKLSMGQPRNPNTELQILRGTGVFFDAMTELQSKYPGDIDVNRDFEKYYSMYDVQGERESDAVVIRARAYSPQAAADLANSIFTNYNRERDKLNKTSNQATLAYLDTQINSVKAKLTEALDNRRKYKAENAIADLPNTNSYETNYSVQVKNSLDTAKTELSQAEQAVLSTKARLEQAEERQNAEKVTQTNPVLLQLRTQLADLKRQRATLLAQYLPDSPNVRQVDDSIKNVIAQINEEKKTPRIEYSDVNRIDPNRQSLENQYNIALISRDSLRQRVENLEKVNSEQQARMKVLPEAERKLADLDREVIVKESNIRSLQLSRDILEDRSASANDAALAPGGLARPNPQPVFPDPLVVSLLSIFGGAALGLLYSFAVESLRLRIYTSYQLADLTGLPVVASLPKLPGGSVRQIEGTLGTASPRILESIRLLAFSLVAQPHEGCRRLLFTGLDRQTGASSSAAQLAIALGHTGAKVILVDADLMGRSSSRIFKAEGQRGLAEALITDSGVDVLGESLRETGSDNVKLMPAGISNDRAVKECETKRLEEVLTWLSGKCDYLVFDTPPCLRNSEAARLASETHEAYLVVSLRMSTVPLVSAALDILRQAGANVVRLVTTEGDRSEEGLAREARVSAASRALPS